MNLRTGEVNEVRLGGFGVSAANGRGEFAVWTQPATLVHRDGRMVQLFGVEGGEVTSVVVLSDHGLAAGNDGRQAVVWRGC